MRNAPTNTDDVIDSRDVIARIEELTEERSDLATALDEAREERDEMPAETGPEPISDAYHDAHCAVLDAEKALEEWDEENAAELKALTELAEQCEGYSDNWTYGAALVRDSYFRTYAQELAEELAEEYDLLERRTTWPYTCIDWDQAARELRMDYTSVEFDGVTYWVR